MLRGLRNFPYKDRPECHNIDLLKERGVEKESGQHSTLHVQELSVAKQTNAGHVSRAVLGRLPRDQADNAWAFLEQKLKLLLVS